MQETKADPVQEFQRCINALALELPESVWDDVNKRWMELKGSQLAGSPGGTWVSVEDKLPESKGYYLCYDTNFGLINPIDILLFEPYNQSWFYRADAYHPQFWMLLPEPPKI